MKQKLEKHHLEDLKKSGLSDITIENAKVYSASADEVREILGFNPTDSAGMVSPYPHTDGFKRVKPDTPPIINGKAAKYLSPKGSGNRIYIPPGVEKVLNAPDIPLYVLEGEKKALRAAQEGLACVALAGVWCFREKGENGEGKIISDFDRITWHGRAVYIVFDSDVPPKPEVHAAGEALAQELRKRGGTVRFINLPCEENKKTGLDDYLVNHSVHEFLQIPQAERMVHTIEGGVGTQPDRVQRRGILKVNASALQAQGEDNKLDSMPFLGREGYIVKGWSHMLAAYPKVGKTELLLRLCFIWQGERILFFTEEPQQVWQARLGRFKENITHVTLAFALGAAPEEILRDIRESADTVVIIDTVRNLLDLQDEKDNSEIARKLNPFIVAACREGKKTLIMAHHLTKKDGEHGKDISGGHAFLGAVDIALVLKFGDSKSENRRVVTGLGRVFSIPPLMYEMGEDYNFVSLGSPLAVEFEEVKHRALETVDEMKRTVGEIRDRMDNPQPSVNNLREALQALNHEGKVECDNPDGGRGRTQHFWRVGSSVHTASPIVCTKLDVGRVTWTKDGKEGGTVEMVSPPLPEKGNNGAESVRLVQETFPAAKVVKINGK